jgi:hypothetical protein
VDLDGYTALFRGRASAKQIREAIDTGPEPIGTNKVRNRLWDSEQAASNADGEPPSQWPQLPAEDSPEDLLDETEAAAFLEMDRSLWIRYAKLPVYPRPAPEEVIGGQSHWYRRTLIEWKANRPGKGAGAGRPPGSHTRRSDGVWKQHGGQTVAMLREGRDLSAPDLVKLFTISDSRARRLLAEARAEVEAPSGRDSQD